MTRKLGRGPIDPDTKAVFEGDPGDIELRSPEEVAKSAAADMLRKDLDRLKGDRDKLSRTAREHFAEVERAIEEKERRLRGFTDVFGDRHTKSREPRKLPESSTEELKAEIERMLGVSERLRKARKPFPWRAWAFAVVLILSLLLGMWAGGVT